MTSPPPPNNPGNESTASGTGAVAAQNIGGNVTTNVTNNYTLPVEPPRPERRLHQLPTPLSDKQFVGRGEERKTLKRILNAAKGGKVALTALRGMGGVGKTTLAVFVANQIKDQFPDAQFFLDLRGTTEPVPPARLMAEVLRAFDPTGGQLPDDPDALAPAYRGALAGRKVLLVLDNAHDAGQVRPLLPPEGCGLIITSRYSMGSLDGVESVPLGELTEDESVKLLRTLVPKRGTDDECKAIAGLCGYLPLALNVAGCFLKGHVNWTPAEYTAALEKERLKRLKIGDDKAKDVEAVLALSAAQLVQEEPSLAERWQMLSVFPADFEEVGAAAVMDCGEGVFAAKDMLSELLDRHLVLFDEDDRRYRLHDLIRDVAAKVFDWGVSHDLGAASEPRREDAARRHAEHYCTVLSLAADRYEEKGRVLQGLRLFDREEVNIRAGQAWAVARPDSDRRALELRRDYTGRGICVLNLRLSGRERVQWTGASVAACRQLGDRRGEGNALGNLGTAHDALGDAKTAIIVFEQALAIAREIGNRRGEANALGNLGNVHAALGDAKKAIVFHEDNLTLAREIGDRRGEANALGNLGIAHRNLRNAHAALAFHEQALAVAREIGERQGEAYALSGIALCHNDLGNARAAIPFHEQHLAVAREMGDRRGEANALGNLGITHTSLGDARAGLSFQERALAVAREIGDRRGEANTAWNMASALAELGEIRQAISFAEQALAYFESIGHPCVEADRRTIAQLRAQLLPPSPGGS